MSNRAGEYVLEATKAAPPVAVTGISLTGIPLETWVMVATLVYTVMNICWFIYDKIIRRNRSRKQNKHD